MQLGRSQKIWSPEEDETILRLIKKYGKNWKLISEMLGSKNGKQIRERYINKLDPRIKREDWSEEEDQKILELYSKLGSKWSEISKTLPGRPENKVKNRFYSFIQKNYEIKYKEVENLDPEPTLHPQKKLLHDIKPTPLLSQDILAARESNQLPYEDRAYSKLLIPSINEIELDLRQEVSQCNNLLGEEEWHSGNNYHSIVELRSTDFFPKLPN